MPFIDTNLNQTWVVVQTPSTGITRNSTVGLYYINSVTNNQSVLNQPDYTTGYTYSQGKNYQIITEASPVSSTIDSLYVRFSAPFKDSVASVTRTLVTSSSVGF